MTIRLSPSVVAAICEATLEVRTDAHALRGEAKRIRAESVALRSCCLQARRSADGRQALLWPVRHGAVRLPGMVVAEPVRVAAAGLAAVD